MMPLPSATPAPRLIFISSHEIAQQDSIFIDGDATMILAGRHLIRVKRLFTTPEAPEAADSRCHTARRQDAPARAGRDWAFRFVSARLPRCHIITTC